jgi:hypothetical protein
VKSFLINFETKKRLFFNCHQALSCNLNPARLAGHWFRSAEPIFCQAGWRQVGDDRLLPLGGGFSGELMGRQFDFCKCDVRIIVTGRFRNLCYLVL